MRLRLRVRRDVCFWPRGGSVMPFCAICEQSVERWLADPQGTAHSSLLRVLEAVGADTDQHICPGCGADDRERHTWMYLASTGVLDDTLGRRALHVGGEARLREKLARLAIDWTFIEESELDRLLRRSDAAHFHLIVCNRILPTVTNVAATIRSLAHALSDSGWLVAQSLYAPMLKRTLAFTVEPTKRAAHLFFGSDRARRLFGSDFAQMFTLAGLQGGPYRHEDVLPGVDGATWGCNPREPFFLFSRSRCLTSPS